MLRISHTFAIYLLIGELIFATVLVFGLVVPLPGKVELKIVQSGSMEPAVPVGAVVVVVPRERYGTGDVVTFGTDTRRRAPTTHRIVATERVQGSLHYRTKGDANEEVDAELVPHSALIGRVAFTVPRLGYVLDFVRTRTGFLCTVVIPASFIILDELVSAVGAARALQAPSALALRESRRRVERHPIICGAGTHSVERPRRAARPSLDGCRVVLRPV